MDTSTYDEKASVDVAIEHAGVDSGSLQDNVSDAVMRRRVLLKTDLIVLPTLFILFLFSFLDRTSIGNARILGLQGDLGLTSSQYVTVLSVYYLFYILVEIPSNLVMKKISPKIWLPLITAIWGAITIGQGFVQTYPQLVVTRCLLGLAEGGLLPGMVTYLSTLYKPDELAWRLCVTYLSNPLSGGFGGLLASGLYKLAGVGGLAGWRWIFIVEGILTVVLGSLAYFTLCDSLETAWFLTPAERVYGQSRLYTNKAADKFSGKAVVHGMFGVQTILTGSAFFCILAALYSFGLFVPTIINGLGYTATQAQLYSIGPYFVAAFVTLLTSILSDRLKLRGPLVLCTLPLGIIGYSMLIGTDSNSVRYIALYIAALGLYPSVPPILTWLTNNVQPYYARSTAAAAQLAYANCSGFVAAVVYPAAQGPYYVQGHSIILGLLCGAWFFTACNLAYCWYENKAKAEGRRDKYIGCGSDLDPSFVYIL